MNRKANMAFLSAFALSFVIAGIYLAMGADITASFGTEFSNTSYAYNITQKVQEGNASIANRLPLVGLVIGIVLVIGYLKMIQ